MSGPARRQAHLVVGLLALVAGGCDSSGEYEACVAVEDPAAAPGGRRLACPPSEFRKEDVRSREIAGIVRRGEDVVPGATVRVEPSAPSDTSVPPSSTVTDAVGVYVGLRAVPLRYDLLVGLDRPGSPRQDVIVFRGVAGRYLEPAIEAPRAFAQAWSAGVDVELDRVVPEGQSLAFFTSGDGVYGVTGDAVRGLTLLTRQYELPATVHVVEFETAGGLEKATAYGKTSLRVSAGVRRRAKVSLGRIERTAEPKFAVLGPPGFTAAAVTIRVGFSRTSDAVLATIPIGTSRVIPIIPDAGFTYQVVATANGTVSDTGENGFDVLAPLTTITLLPPPLALAPLAGGSRAPGETLDADGPGVFEHVLVPESGGPSIRMISAARKVALPDTTVLGAPRAVGPYTWTVRSFPKARFAEDLSGIDSRRYRAMGSSVARRIELR